MPPQCRAAAAAPCALVVLSLLAACATPPTSTKGSTAPTTPSAQRFNLAGYSVSFKQGYADACATPRRRIEERFKTDTDYRMGWQDGQSVCKK